MGENVEDGDLVRQSLNDMTNTWTMFVESIVARGSLHKWDYLWDDFTQEEN